MRRMPVIRVRRVRRAVSRRRHLKACTRICPRAAATEGTSCMWCPARPQSLMSRKKTEGLRPSEMRRRKYVVDSDLRESADTRANPRDTLEDQRIRAKELVAIHGKIEMRNDDDSLELFDQRDESNQEIQAKPRLKRGCSVLCT